MGRTCVLILWLGMGCATHDAPAPDNCAAPAPLTGDPGGGRFIVTFKDGVAADAEVERLSSIYSIQSPQVLSILPGFVAEFGAPVVARLRCEPSIKAIDQDQAGGGA